MRRRQHAHVHRHRLVAAHRPHHALLQHAQQLDLQRQRHVADLVQQHRAAVRRGDQALPVPLRPRERTLHMPEQLGLQQRLGDGRAVDRDKRLARTRAGLVDRTGQQFLARAALAADQHAGVRGRHQPRLGQHLGHAGAAADDLAAPGAIAVERRRPRRVHAQRLLYLGQQLLAVEGLGQVGVRAARRGVHRIRDAAVRGQQDDRQRRVVGAHLVEQRQAVHAGQAHVGDQQRRQPDGQMRQRGLGAGHGLHGVAGRGQPHGDQAQQVGVVVDQQDVGLGGAHGALPGLPGNDCSMAFKASSFSLSCSLRRWASRSWTVSLSMVSCCRR
jgi:hypothetical protein